MVLLYVVDLLCSVFGMLQPYLSRKACLYLCWSAELKSLQIAIIVSSDSLEYHVSGFEVDNGILS